jgi:hypothetical protein
MIELLANLVGLVAFGAAALGVATGGAWFFQRYC